MGEFIKTQAFKELNIGFALDEGIASPTEDFLIFNCERAIQRMILFFKFIIIFNIST